MVHSTSLDNMIKQQLRATNVLDESVISLFQSIPRTDFVPQELESFAYSDMQMPIAHNQRMMTPTEEALLLQALSLQGHETILEVGTGTGFLTALLSRCCDHIVSVDFYADFTLKAQTKLKQYECNNVTLITGDAINGWLEKAPYDVVIFTGGLPALTKTHMLQVLPGGTLFAVVGNEPSMQGQLLTLAHDKTWSKQILFETCLPPLVNKLTPKHFVF